MLNLVAGNSSPVTSSTLTLSTSNQWTLVPTGDCVITSAASVGLHLVVCKTHDNITGSGVPTKTSEAGTNPGVGNATGTTPKITIRPASGKKILDQGEAANSVTADKGLVLDQNGDYALIQSGSDNVVVLASNRQFSHES